MASHHPTNFSDSRHCGSGDMFLMVKGQNSTFSHLNPPLLFSLKHIICHVRRYEISQQK